MCKEVIKLILNKDTNITCNKEYFVECDNFEYDYLELRTGRFDKSIISGYIKNLTTKINLCSVTFKNVTFENCKFTDESWLDMSEFINCIFINCTFNGEIRWLKFNKCSFENTHFDVSYIRGTTFRKNCTFNNITIKAKYLDNNLWLFGKKYKNDYHSDRDAINFKG